MNWKFWKRDETDIQNTLDELEQSKKAGERAVDLQRRADRSKQRHRQLRKSNGFAEKVAQLYADRGD